MALECETLIGQVVIPPLKKARRHNVCRYPMGVGGVPYARSTGARVASGTV